MNIEKEAKRKKRKEKKRNINLRIPFSTEGGGTELVTAS
jgi:hypothetical protein